MNLCISDITIDIVRRQLLKPLEPDLGKHSGEITQGVLRITTDEGVEGNCFIGEHWGRGTPRFQPIIDVIKPDMVGRSATEREWLWARQNYLGTRFSMTTQTWAPVDIALWDLAGKAAGLPVYQLLGAQRHEVPAYATFPTLHDTPEGFVSEAETVQAKGFPAYKIHPGLLPESDVITMVEMVREQVGDGFPLMLDPNCGYNFASALRIGQALDGNEFYWFEDPVASHNLDAIVELSRRLMTPLSMSDQAPFQLFDSAQFIRRGAVRIPRGTALRLGITGLRKLCALAESFGLKCEIGTAGNPLTNAANLHVLLSIDNADFFEYLYPEETERFGLTNYIEPDSNGIIAAPSAPGLGFELDESWIAKHRVATLS